MPARREPGNTVLTHFGILEDDRREWRGESDAPISLRTILFVSLLLASYYALIQWIAAGVLGQQTVLHGLIFGAVVAVLLLATRTWRQWRRRPPSA